MKQIPLRVFVINRATRKIFGKSKSEKSRKNENKKDRSLAPWQRAIIPDRSLCGQVYLIASFPSTGEETRLNADVGNAI
jgi:hypothetical protein